MTIIKTSLAILICCKFSFGQTLNLVAPSGNVNGPSSATDNAVVRFDNTTGKLIQNSGVTVSDSGNIVGVGATFSAAVTPATNDAAALGSSSLSWSDLFLASGGVINWNNGDVTLTQSTDRLTMAGGDLTVNGFVGVGGNATYALSVSPTVGATPQQTMLVYDATASTGVTGLVLKDGAGQGSSVIFKVLSNADAFLGGIDQSGSPFVLDVSGNFLAQMLSYNSGGMEVNNAGYYSFSSTNQSYDTPDTALYRNAAGIIEVNNGTSGTLRDITTRNTKGATFSTGTNCSDSAGAAACGSAASGSVVIDAAATTVVVSTTAITANSQILIQEDSSLGTRLSVTCNTTPQLNTVTARIAATSFTIATAIAPVANPRCFNYWIVN